MQVPGLLDANFAALHMLITFELSKVGRAPALLNADVAMADLDDTTNADRGRGDCRTLLCAHAYRGNVYTIACM